MDQILKGVDEGGPIIRAPKLLGNEYSPHPISLWALIQPTSSSPTSRSRVDVAILIEKAQLVVASYVVPLHMDSYSTQFPFTLNWTS